MQFYYHGVFFLQLAGQFASEVKYVKNLKSDLSSYYFRDVDGFYQCRVCPEYKQKTSGNMRAHVESKHYTPGYNCKVCGKFFRIQISLHNHNRICKANMNMYWNKSSFLSPLFVADLPSEVGRRAASPQKEVPSLPSNLGWITSWNYLIPVTYNHEIFEFELGILIQFFEICFECFEFSYFSSLNFKEIQNFVFEFSQAWDLRGKTRWIFEFRVARSNTYLL